MKASTFLKMSAIVLLIAFVAIYLFQKRPGRGDSSEPVSPDGGPTPSCGRGCDTIYKGCTFPLKRGMCGDNVAKLQSWINSTGDNYPNFVPIAVDGKFGPGTEQALNDVREGAFFDEVAGQASKSFFDNFVK